MTVGTTNPPSTELPTTNNIPFEDKNAQAGDWAIHSWGNSKFPGMAAISAIETLQLSATLSETPTDKIAMNKAAEYLSKALASQIRSFQEASAKSPKFPKLR
jgi:hypothetical protein